jgi:hypothetical protein
MTKYTQSNLKLAANKIVADAVICAILLGIAYIGYLLRDGLMILSMSFISGVMVLAANNFIFWLKCRKYLAEKERG